MHKILISNLKIYGYHGVYEIERKNGQFFLLNISYSTSIKIDDDNLCDAIDYMKILAFIEELFNKKKFNLIELLSEHIANSLVKEYKFIYVKVSIAKSNKFINKEIENIISEYEIDNE